MRDYRQRLINYSPSGASLGLNQGGASAEGPSVGRVPLNTGSHFHQFAGSRPLGLGLLVVAQSPRGLRVGVCRVGRTRRVQWHESFPDECILVFPENGVEPSTQSPIKTGGYTPHPLPVAQYPWVTAPRSQG